MIYILLNNKSMVSSNNNSVLFVVYQDDLLSDIKQEFKIVLEKEEENQVSGDLTPTIIISSFSTIVFNFCIVDLINEDLPNGSIYLPYFGQYKMSIYTKDLLDIDQDLIQTDLFLKKGNDVTYIL